MSNPKFMIMEGSRSNGYEFWVSVIIYNVRNGFSRVEQRTPNGWCAPSATPEATSGASLQLSSSCPM